jgi:hypothetical protein
VGYQAELLVARFNTNNQPLTFGSAAFLIAQRSYFASQMLGKLLDTLEFVSEVFAQEATTQRFDVWLYGLGQLQQFSGFALQCACINP